MTLSVRGLHVLRGDREVLRGVDLDVAPGEICALMGASGAGKTTVLRAVAALQPFDAGTIAVDEVVLQPGPLPPQSQLGALRRHVGMVFQAHALFEHLTALDNVTLAPIHVLRWDRARAESVARELLESLGVAARAECVAAPAVGRRGAARRDRTRARAESVAAADGRADRGARSGAPRRARRNAARPGAAGPGAARVDARRRLRARVRRSRRHARRRRDRSRSAARR